MTKSEVGKLLATAAAFDQRTTGIVDIDAWHAVIGHLDYEVAREAVINWYKHNTDRIMPANILAATITPGDEHMHR